MLLVSRPFNTPGALQRAKKAVERHYAVVGVLEDLNSTLTVLENYIPLFFKGATQVYWGMYSIPAVRTPSLAEQNPSLLMIMMVRHTITMGV
jgi:uncharacterized membrane protein